MTAEKYLERIKKIDAIIASRIRDHKRFVELSEWTGGFSAGERVQSSMILQRGSHAVIEYISIEEEIERLKNERQAIIRTIERLPICEYSVLCMIYIEDYALKEIASFFDRSYDWVKKKKREALRMIQRIIDDEHL